MLLMKQMIRTGRFTEFVTEIVKLRNEELDDKASWEYWLHKDFEHSFGEFLESLKQPEEVSKQDLASIVSQSAEIASFVPQEEE